MKNKAIVKKYNSKTKPHLVAIVVYKDDKDIRKKKYFSTMKEAERFAGDYNLKLERFGKQAKNINEIDTQNLILIKKKLLPYNIEFSEVVRIFIEATETLKPYNSNILKAVAHFTKWNEVKKQSITLDKAISEYINYLKSEKKSLVHISKSTQRLNRFKTDFKPSCVVALLEPKQIETWLNNLNSIEYKKIKAKNSKEEKHIRVETKKSISLKTKDNYKRALTAFFNFCMKKDYLEQNPLNKVSAITLKKEEPKIYKVDEISKMLNCSKELSQERLFIALGAFAGLRVAEMFRLSWSNIHFDDKEIELSSAITKTNKRRMVKISDNLLAWLKPYVSEKLKNGLLFKSEASLRKSLTKFRTDNNISWIDNGLRHSSASYYLALTQNAPETALRMGHSITVLESNYKGLVREKDALAYWNIYPKAKTSVIDASNILKESIA